MSAIHVPGIKAPPSTAYKIVDVAENYKDVIQRHGLPGTFVGPSMEESPWVPFGDKAAIRHLAFDPRHNTYGNILWIGRRQHLLFISERSRLPVVIPIREGKRLAEVFPDAVCEVLGKVSVAAADISDERSRMSEIAFGRTKNRSLLGTLNDFAFMAQVGSARRPEPETPEELIRFLAQTPILPLDGASPIELTRAVFRGK